MKTHHQFFSLPKPVYYLLVLLNVAYAFWLNHEFGSPWGWRISDLADEHQLLLTDFMAIGQFVLLAFTADMSIRHFLQAFNAKTQRIKVPEILVQAISVASYALIGLIGFIAIYDHTFSHVLAASGAIGLGVAYAFREMIADIVACIQIQSDGLIGIGDYIEVKEDGVQYLCVVQMDRRMVTLRTPLEYIVRIPNRRFINLSYINISKQHPEMGARRKVEVDIDSGNDSAKIVDLLSQTMEYVIKTNENFYPWYRIFFSKINSGAYAFNVYYECKPGMTVNVSNSTVNLAAARFLKLGGINMNSTVEVSRSHEIVDNVKSRLKEVYRQGVLKALSLDQVIQLSNASEVVSCRSGHHLIEKGQQADSMYFLVEGCMEVTIPNNQGEQVVVATIWPGDCVGEMSLLTGEPRSANVRARTNSMLLLITKNDISPIFESNPELIEEISEVLERRKASNQSILNQKVQPEEVQKNIKLLAKKILSYFFNKG